MKDLQRRLLMGEQGQRIEMLRSCCQSGEGQSWCRQRFSVFEVLEWMWAENTGNYELLAHWQPAEELVVWLQSLVPEGYQPQRLAKMLFPVSGAYRLDDQGITGARSFSFPSELMPLLRRKAREMPAPSGFRWRESKSKLELVAQEQGPRISLSSMPLEESRAEMVAYGAKDNGEMGGGASGALLVAAGPALEEASRKELARCSREVGEVYLTPAFGSLLESGVGWVCHIISILKYTDQGAWCPHPELLEVGVARALAMADEKAVHTIAFSALGTGEGRVTPDHSARMMVSAARKHLRENPESPLRVVFCLPTERDYEAFERALAG